MYLANLAQLQSGWKWSQWLTDMIQPSCYRVWFCCWYRLALEGRKKTAGLSYLLTGYDRESIPHVQQLWANRAQSCNATLAWSAMFHFLKCSSISSFFPIIFQSCLALPKKAMRICSSLCTWGHRQPQRLGYLGLPLCHNVAAEDLDFSEAQQSWWLPVVAVICLKAGPHLLFTE